MSIEIVRFLSSPSSGNLLAKLISFYADRNSARKRVIIENEISKLEARIKELEKRQEWAEETLRSIANEQIHRLHGCDYPEIDPEDLYEIVDILTGKTEI